jgi:hypothetical protein
MSTDLTFFTNEQGSTLLNRFTKVLDHAKYLLYLPTEEELKHELEIEKHLAELEIAKQKD